MESDNGLHLAARGGLDDIAEARAALAQRVVAPPWYPLLVGLLVAQHVLAQGVGRGEWTLPSGILLVVGSAVAWLLWQRGMGLTLGAWAGWRSLLLLGLWSLVALVSVRIAAATDDLSIVVGVAVAALIACVLVGQAYVATLRRDVRGPGGPGAR